MRAGSLAIVCFLVAGCASGMPTPDNSPTASPSSAAAPSGTPVRSPTATPEGPGPTDTPAPTSAASMTPSAAPTATPAATPAASPSAAPASLIGGWKRISDKKALSDPVEDVTWTGNRFVATAWDRFIDSEDGLAWHRQARAGRGAVIQSIASGPGGVVATGTLGETRASWWSADGLTWKVGRRAFPYRARGGNWVLATDVVATDDGWLAVGREDPFCMFTCSPDPTRALVWRSSDGLRWTRVDADQKALQGGAMNAVARVGSGYVAVGAIGERAAIWRSRDGSRWTSVRDSRVFQPRSRPSRRGLTTEAADVAAGPGSVSPWSETTSVPRTSASGWGARAWWSEDGRTWAQRAHAPLEGRPGLQRRLDTCRVPGGRPVRWPDGRDELRRRHVDLHRRTHVVLRRARTQVRRLRAVHGGCCPGPRRGARASRRRLGGRRGDGADGRRLVAGAALRSRRPASRRTGGRLVTNASVGPLSRRAGSRVAQGVAGG